MAGEFDTVEKLKQWGRDGTAWSGEKVLLAHIADLEAALEVALSIRIQDDLTATQWTQINSVRKRTDVGTIAEKERHVISRAG